MGNEQAKPRGDFRELNPTSQLDFPPKNQKDSRATKKDELYNFLEPIAFSSIYPPPDTQVIKTKCRKPTEPALQKVIRMALNAQPVEEEKEARVNAHDGRIQVVNTARWPNSVHGIVVCKPNNLYSWGTGILIGPNIVLTAGHILYDHHAKAFADLKSLQFLPGVNGQACPFGDVEVEKYYVSPNYIKEEKEDYGILILKEPIGHFTGYFGLACLEPDELKSKTINVTGYPGDKVHNKPMTFEIWGMEDRVARIDKDQGYIDYLIDAVIGQNGAGVWYQEGDNYYVCGVHVSGTMFVNRATLLTRAVYKQIYNWLNQDPNTKWFFAIDSIERLEFESFQLDIEHLQFLVQENLAGLTTLNLFSKKIRPQGAKVLAGNTSWINLSILNLYNNHIGPEGAIALAKNTSWKNLSCLNLTLNNIGTEGAKALGQNTSWTQLSKLSLGSNGIGPEGAIVLAQNSSWANLSWLSLKNNYIGAEGARALVLNPSWTKLKYFNFKDNDIDDPEAEAEIANLLR